MIKRYLTAVLVAACIVSAPAVRAGEGGVAGEFFKFFFQALGETESVYTGRALFFGESTEAQARETIGDLPRPPREVVRMESYEKRYRFMQANFEHSFLVFKFGNQDDAWNGVLYSLSFTVKTPADGAADPGRDLWARLRDAYGEPTRVEPFRYSETEVEEGLDVHVWELEKKTVRFRTFTEEKDNLMVTVLEFWDREFLEGRPVYNY